MSSVFEQQTTDESKLTHDEQQRLVSCESLIQEFLFETRKVNAALIEIREKRLFRQHYRTFESYVKAKWPALFGGFSRMRVWQVLEHETTLQAIESSEFVNESLQNGAPTEWQTRPLNSLPVEDRPAAYALAVAAAGSQKPTGAQVSEVVAALQPSQATSERIGRLDTDRAARPSPPQQTFRKGFRVSEFKFDPNMRRFHFQVFKPANTFKGWPSKTEQLQISLTDLEWELRNVGFDLVKAGGAGVAQSDADAEEDELVDATGEQADPADVALTLDMPADVDVGVRALVAKERRRIASFTAPPPAAEEEPVAPSFVTGDVSYIDEMAQPNPVGAFFADYPQ